MSSSSCSRVTAIMLARQDSTMFQLRSFIHQRMYAAAEEILGEVEKTMTFAMSEAEVSRSIEEVGSPRHQPDLLQEKTAAEPSLTSSTLEDGGECDAQLLQKNQGDESNSGLSAEVPVTSQASGLDPDNNNWNYCLADTDLKMSDVKQEWEELEDGGQMQGAVFPSPDAVKSEEQDQLGTRELYEMQPVSSDCSQAQSESDQDNDDEELVSNEGEETKSINQQGNTAQTASGQRENKKDRSFCHLCGKGFQYVGSLMKHIKTHKKNTDCTICGVTCTSTRKLIDHLEASHTKAYFCKVCGKTLASARGLRLHKRTHTDNKFMCQECGKTFNRKHHLVGHVRTHSGEKPYHCDTCGKAFSQSQNLTMHMRSHSGERPYHCDQCGKLFSKSSQLKAHMRYHTGEKPYPCDICGKRFSQSGQMTRHRTTHTGERPYACHLCGMRYRFAPNLKVHLKTHEMAGKE